jgi:NADH-quinone oxidoreductase subunit N
MIQLPHLPMFFYNFALAIPEIWVLSMVALTLLAGLFLSRKIPSITYILTQVTLVGSMLLSIAQLVEPAAITFNGLYMMDNVGNWLKIFIDISAFGSFYYARNYIHERNIPESEYYLLGLLSVLGMMILCSAHSLLMIYLGLETFALPIYAMIALRREMENALEAAIKYFIMGAIASGMLLYGMSMVYGATGSLDFTHILNKIAASGGAHQLMLSFALVFLIAGIGFKLASVPFHMWAPDVYAGSPTSVTLFLSTVPELAAMGMTIRLLLFALPGMFAQWQPLLIVLAVLSIGASSIIAMVQTNIKRLLAYSAIGHMGYALFGLIAGTPEGYAFSLFYILMYVLMGLGSFGLITLMSQQGIEIESIEDFKGLNARNSWLAFLMMLVMLSLAGVPPMVGFFAKLFVLKALVDVHMTGLAIFGLVMAVISAFYYIKIIKVMYFDTPSLTAGKIVITKGARAMLSINVLALLFLGIFPTGLIQACLSAFGM